MATKARQQYFADEDSLQKIRREFSIADDIQQKIDSIEPWAQVNKIETVKVNWTALVPDANKAVNVEVPEVIDNLYTVDSDNALSAKQWKLLYDYIQNIASRWRFLSNWNSATGLPMTNPSESPYPYKSWDYFVVSNVATSWGTNYRPDGSSYTIWQASTVVETDSVDVSDFYFYDGTNWLLLKNSGRSWAVDTSLSTTSTNPVENRVITNALNWKQETLIAWNHIDITNNVISAEWFQEELTAGENITIGDICHPNTQWPAPDWFHLPIDELKNVLNILTNTFSNCGFSSKMEVPENILKMPRGWRIRDDNWGIDGRWNAYYYWYSKTSYYTSYGGAFYATGDGFYDWHSNGWYATANWFPIRAFKDMPVQPDNTWTVIYDWSAIATWAWVFYNAIDWLISISWDWTTRYTMMDKNLWATQVYNYWDTLNDSNCWLYYQWWNNHWFPSDLTWVTTSTTLVDVAWYWPWNYYDSDVFIISTQNPWSWFNWTYENLWWWTAPSWTWCELAISAVDTTYTAWTWISIDANNVISSTATSAQWWNITWTLSNQTDLQNALDSKVNLWINKVFDNTVVEIWKWEHEPGGDSSGHHIELDPNGEVSTYNLTQAWHNEATLWSGTLELLNNTALDWNKTATFDHEKIVADDWTDTETYNFFGNNRIARLSDLDSWVNTKTFFLNREATQADKIATLQEVYDWIKDWTRNAIIEWVDEEAGNLYPDKTFILSDIGISEASWNPTLYYFQNWFVSDFTQPTLRFSVLNDTVTNYGYDYNRKIARAGNWINITGDRISNTLPWPTIATTAPTGTEWALWYDTTNDVLMAYNWTAWKEAWTQMKVLSYGHSTWQNFLDAYNENAVVYCRASSSSDPSTGSQWRLAFMAYVNNANNPTEVEFQYYRSRSDHNSAANQLDEVYVYKLTSNWTWTVTQRNTWAKAVAWTWISLWWGSGNMTISADTTTLATKTDLNSKQDTLVSWTNIQIDTTTNTISATDTIYNAGTGISIWNITKNWRQWPSPDGFHVPTIAEWQWVKTIMDWLSLITWDGWRINLHMPFAGYRYYIDGTVGSQGVYANYWSSSPRGGSYPERARYLGFYSGNVSLSDAYYRAYGASIRCFKNEYVTPDSTWTTVQWTLGSAWIFWNQSEWLISITDGSTGYTIMDKNLWATTVYNDWDTLSEANCGKYYQRWNNYWFSRTGSVTTSSTQLDASSYWPNTNNWYYSSDIFIIWNGDWSSVHNDDLWWDTTWTITIEDAITNTGVLSVNGQTGNVTIPTWLQESPNSTITGIKYIRHWTEADYANLSQYYTDVPGDTEFHCF